MNEHIYHIYVECGSELTRVLCNAATRFYTVAPAKSHRNLAARTRRFTVSFFFVSSLSFLSPRVYLVLFIRKRVAIVPMPRDIADAILHTIPVKIANAVGSLMGFTCAALIS